jgi:hypothetical protein
MNKNGLIKFLELLLQLAVSVSLLVIRISIQIEDIIIHKYIKSIKDEGCRVFDG